MITEFKALWRLSSHPLYTVLRKMVIVLCKNLSWLQDITAKQSFCWSIVASCCEKIPISKEQLHWCYSYESVITCLGSIFNSYCEGKKLPEHERLLSSESIITWLGDLYCEGKNVPKDKHLVSYDAKHSSLEDIRRYELCLSPGHVNKQQTDG